MRRFLHRTSMRLLFASMLCITAMTTPPATAQLSGTYTINPVGGNYTSIGAAVTALTTSGVSGAVTFNIAPATYNESITIPAIAGASSTNTITFNGTDVANCIVTYSTAQYGFIFKLDGADYIRIQNLTLTATGASYGYGVMLTNQADYNQITGCRINVNTTSTNTDNVGILATGSNSASGTGNSANNTLVQNNTITGGYYGIRFNGTSTTTTCANNQLLNNQILQWYYYGVYMYYQSAAKANGNTVTDRGGNSSSYGIYMYYGRSGPEAVNNSVRAGMEGVYFNYCNQDSTTRGKIINNMIVLNGTSTNYGIDVESSFMIDIWYNSLLLTTTTGTGYAMYLTGGPNLRFDVRNNAAMYTGTGTFYGVYAPGATPLHFIAMDYNANYRATGTYSYYFGGTTYTTLASAQSAYPTLIQHNIQADPMYLSATDLHSISIDLNGAATPIASVTTDIDGNTRNATTPDIGADEFAPLTLDVAFDALVSPAPKCELTSSETVRVRIKNKTLTPFDASVTPITVNISTSGAATQSISGTINTGTIAANSSAEFTLASTLNMSTFGLYTINGTITVTGDQYTANNTLTPVAMRTESGISVFPYNQNFEASNGGWTPTIVSGTSMTWAWGVPNHPNTGYQAMTTAHSGTNVWMTGLTSGYLASENNALTSPCLDFSSLISPMLSFWMFYCLENNYDAVVVEASSDLGTTWTKLTPANPAYNNTSTYGPIVPPKYSGTTTIGWNKYTFNLAAYGSMSGIKLRFHFGSDGSGQYGGVAIDDITIANVPSKDLEFVSIVEPVQKCGLTTAEPVTVRLKNTSFNTFNAATDPVTVTLNVAGPVAQTIIGTITTGTLAPDASGNFTLSQTMNLATPGNYTFTGSIAMTGDQDPLNNQLPVPVQFFSDKTVTMFPYTEDFETSDGMWKPILLTGSSMTWAWGTPNYPNSGYQAMQTAHSGTKAWMTGLTTGYVAYEDNALTSPCLDFTTLTSPVLSFWMFYCLENGWDGVVIDGSTDGGATWTKLTPVNPAYNSTSTSGPIAPPKYSGTTTLGWNKYVFALPYAGLSGVKLRVHFGSDGSGQYGGVIVDDISIGDFLEKDITVTSVRMNNTPDAWARIETKPHTIEATIRNLGYEANPASVTLVYKANSNPNDATDGIAQTFAPVWNGNEATVSFTVPFTPAAPGYLPFFVRAFYTGDLYAGNDYAMTLPNVQDKKTFGYEDFELLTPPNWEKGWTVNNANAGTTWTMTAGNGISSSNAATYTGENATANDWLITPAAVLGAGSSYSLKFQYRSRTGAPQILDVAWGTTPDPASMTVFASYNGFTNTDFTPALNQDGVAPYFNTPNVSQAYYVGFHVRSNANAGELDLDNIQLLENPTPPPKIAYGDGTTFIVDPAIPIAFSAVYKKSGMLTRTYTVLNATGKYGNPEGDFLWDVTTGTNWIKLTKSVPDPLTYLASNPFRPEWARQNQTFTMEIDPSNMTPGKMTGAIAIDGYLWNVDYPNGIRASNAVMNIPVELTIVGTGGTGQNPVASATFTGLTPAGSPYEFRDPSGNLFATVSVVTGTIPSMKITSYPGQLPRYISRYRYVKHYWTIDAPGTGWAANVQFHYFDSEVAAGSVADEYALRGMRIAPKTSFWEDPIVNTTSTPDGMQNYVLVTNINPNNCTGQIAVAHDWNLKPPAKESAGFIPAEVTLSQNYPNPFNPSTKIGFGIPERGHVTLIVTNSLGKEVARLVDEELEAGMHEAAFDASGLPSGVYMYTLKTGATMKTQSMTLSK